MDVFKNVFKNEIAQSSFLIEFSSEFQKQKTSKTSIQPESLYDSEATKMSKLMYVSG